eukprot:2941177-Pyramimonas_sp.AAC.1
MEYCPTQRVSVEIAQGHVSGLRREMGAVGRQPRALGYDRRGVPQLLRTTHWTTMQSPRRSATIATGTGAPAGR